MEDWTKKTDHEVFTGAHEQPGSQASYWRDVEIRRRLYLLQKEVTEEQIAASQAQIKAADATVQTAYWTKMSAIAVGLTVVITGASVFLQSLAITH
ncbi:hypothetical protein [Rhizobium indigoferae]|uniref:Uncharacterized protein n=1 Tax=Rhizobium indigoferae TaxID=158891 RepID=A0ABZ0Z9L6_9HYPH|nr:hypothetical protein [Rhizobium indigoferae]NNU57223.1 hypothetical protein [Rhizobium indigoferae]WQN35149.1 hypothetical protein U5G49_000172 [Rhizobium indigoferae]GLR60286.1 hypothetical protein GCM10007919_50140 [Rhizobium indigoferae]